MLNSKSNTRVEIWKGIPTIVFESEILENFASCLGELSLENIKGPRYTKNHTPWHITLYPGCSIDNAKLIEQSLKSSKTRLIWKLIICEKLADGSFTWTDI